MHTYMYIYLYIYVSVCRTVKNSRICSTVKCKNQLQLLGHRTCCSQQFARTLLWQMPLPMPLPQAKSQLRATYVAAKLSGAGSQAVNHVARKP